MSRRESSNPSEWVLDGDYNKIHEPTPEKRRYSRFDDIRYKLSKFTARMFVLSLIILFLFVTIALSSPTSGLFPTGLHLTTMIFMFILGFNSLAVSFWFAGKWMREHLGKYWKGHTAPHPLENDGIWRIALYICPSYSPGEKVEVNIKTSLMVASFQIFISSVFLSSVLSFIIYLMENNLLSQISGVNLDVSSMAAAISVLLGPVFGLLTLTAITASPTITAGLVVLLVIGVPSIQLAPAVRNIHLAVAEMIYLVTNPMAKKTAIIVILLMSITSSLLPVFLFWEFITTI